MWQVRPEGITPPYRSCDACMARVQYESGCNTYSVLTPKCTSIAATLVIGFAQLTCFPTPKPTVV